MFFSSIFHLGKWHFYQACFSCCEAGSNIWHFSLLPPNWIHNHVQSALPLSSISQIYWFLSLLYCCRLGPIHSDLVQRSPTFLASGTGFVEVIFSTDWGAGGGWFQDDSSTLHSSSLPSSYQRLGASDWNRPHSGLTAFILSFFFF